MTPPRSAASRILSASAASWVRVAITMITQIALVPLYLDSWDTTTYGAWLLLQAVWTAVSMVDLAHLDYVGYECLRLGPGQRSAIASIVFSASPIVVMIASWDLLLVWQVGQANFVAGWVGDDASLLEQWRTALLLQAVTWLLTGCLGGLIVRWLTPFGYWSQFAWWGVVHAIVTAMAPALAVVVGGDLLQAMLTLCLTNLTYNLFFFFAIARIVSKKGFYAARPSFRQGLMQGYCSLWLVAKSLAEIVRQQGIRIILAPLVGVAEMTAFATMRTGANFALQGLSTITSPVMPEMMRFLAVRDQARTEGAFAIVWLVLCAVLCPAIVIVQFLAPMLFPQWTHDKIAFDPWLFGLLSLGVSVLALAQPAAAVLQGNNILREQFAISILAAVVAVGGMSLLIPLMGISGAALALLTAELTSLATFVWAAQQLLRQQGMRWPWKAFSAAATELPITALGMVALELLPVDLKVTGLALTLVLQAIVVIIYWRHLPALARMRAASLMSTSLRPTRMTVDKPAVNRTTTKL